MSARPSRWHCRRRRGGDDTLALKELISAIARLPIAQARPLVLTGAYGYSQLEAAAACGCTVGTIKCRVSRARTTLDRDLGHDDRLRSTRRAA